MRTIKFKGKCLKNGKWVYGYFYEECGNTYIIEDTQHQRNDLCARNIPYRVIPETVRQFTDNHDKNGKEIYEGDILEFPNSEIELVEFSQSECGFICGIEPLGFVPADRASIIGNIYDNPNLIKRKE